MSQITESPQCYICYDPETPQNPYIQACRCKGTLMIHASCLQTISMYQKKCVTCNSPYNLPKRYRNGLELEIKHRHPYIRIYTVDTQGRRHGLFQEWYNQTILTKVEYYIHGNLEGCNQSWHDDGNIEYTEIYKPNYKVREYSEGGFTIEPYPPNLPYTICGLRREWHNGILTSIEYYDYVTSQGLSQSWYNSGTYKAEFTEDDNLNTGTSRHFYENTNLQSIVHYNNVGLRQGIEKEYHENGDISKIVYHVKDRKNGILQEFENDGRMSAFGKYTDRKEGFFQLWHEKDWSWEIGYRINHHNEGLIQRSGLYFDDEYNENIYENGNIVHDFDDTMYEGGDTVNQDNI